MGRQRRDGKEKEGIMEEQKGTAKKGRWGGAWSGRGGMGRRRESLWEDRGAGGKAGECLYIADMNKLRRTQALISISWQQQRHKLNLGFKHCADRRLHRHVQTIKTQHATWTNGTVAEGRFRHLPPVFRIASAWVPTTNDCQAHRYGSSSFNIGSSPIQA